MKLGVRKTSLCSSVVDLVKQIVNITMQGSCICNCFLCRKSCMNGFFYIQLLYWFSNSLKFMSYICTFYICITNPIKLSLTYTKEHVNICIYLHVYISGVYTPAAFVYLYSSLMHLFNHFFHIYQISDYRFFLKCSMVFLSVVCADYSYILWCIYLFY